jgi:glyoxylase-like metal-dependent hydrolase (beta-lactamase superfamily II)
MLSKNEIPWRQSINPHISHISTIQAGDVNGYGGIFDIILFNGRVISAIGLPHHYTSRTGPTWAYLTDHHGLTLIDAGSQGSLETLKAGLDTLGVRITSIERLILSHGHQDHDGNAYDFLQSSGAELWAHKMYFEFLEQDTFDYNFNLSSPLHNVLRHYQERMFDWLKNPSNNESNKHWMEHNEIYKKGHSLIKKGQVPSHIINDNEIYQGMKFIYTPGHSVDQMCISLDNVVFTGDHVLPQISPHPTFKQQLPSEISYKYNNGQIWSDEYFGLKCYINSLGKMLSLATDTSVLPAHRLHNNRRLHIRNVSRAKEIIRHHSKRMWKIVEAIDNGAKTVEDIAKKVFIPKKLIGGGIFAAINEVVSHLEFLVDSGDIMVSVSGKISSNKTTNFQNSIEKLISKPDIPIP